MRGCIVGLVVLLLFATAASAAARTESTPADPRLQAGELLYADDFKHGLSNWKIESEKPGQIAAREGTLDIDVPAGVTLWFKRRLTGPVMIQYQVTVLSAGGPNDRVSDLNSFWMASDPRSPGDLFSHARTGAFAEYNALCLYYVGLGGNGNTTTRFRRYRGDQVQGPLLPENDLSVAQRPAIGIVANRSQSITLIADGSLIQYWRDGEKIFEMIDPAPYTRGWFGLRTTSNHMQVRNLHITRLKHTLADSPRAASEPLSTSHGQACSSAPRRRQNNG